MEVLNKNFIKNSSINIIGNLFSKICKYFCIFFAIRVLGVVDYGHYVLGLTIISLGTIFSNIGLSYGIFRFVPIFRAKKDLEKIKGVIVFCGKLLFFNSVIVSISLFCLSDYLSNTVFVKPELNVFLRVLVFALPFTIITMFSDNVFKGFNKIKYKVITEDIFIMTLRLILFGACMILGLKAYNILYSYVITLISGSILGLYFVFKLFPDLLNRSIKAVYSTKEIISYSLPLFLSRFLALILNRIDIIMIGYYLPSEDIGIYSISNRLAEVVFFIAVSIFAVFSPTIAEEFGKGKKDNIKFYLQKVTKVTLMLTTPIFFVIILLSDELLGIFGDEFISGKVPLNILAVSFLLNSILGYYGQVLGVTGRSKLIFLNSFFGAIINIILNLILIPKYGLIGAALATGSSIFLVNIARVLEVYYLDKLIALKYDLFYPVFIGIISSGVILYIKNIFIFSNSLTNLFVFSIGFCGIYALLTLMFGLSKKEIIIIKETFKC